MRSTAAVPAGCGRVHQYPSDDLGKVRKGVNSVHLRIHKKVRRFIGHLVEVALGKRTVDQSCSGRITTHSSIALPEPTARTNAREPCPSGHQMGTMLVNTVGLRRVFLTCKP